MSVGQYCNREVIVTSLDTSILEVAQLMRRHHVGDVLVVEQQGEQNIPVGIVTDRDLVIEILAEEIALDAVTVKDVMSSAITISEKADLWDTLQQMRYQGIRRMPVVNEKGSLEGILTVDDVLALLAEGLTDLVKLVKHEIEQESRLRSKP
ncbi:CBS domain containing protein [Nitrosococcus halophilus Nc 4]|uniref:CBS domain containing protein n=1 Tax=Nitrosococcus halophilus (strain Nc4) TaxID=472759 RepID=D5BWX2_NITHN|nr:CBS domain-containing protein [Nitrosococcus halophilus]ADE13853.1 CBS domain containing protein [Nitrosococcus halophilus Nc 4]